VLVVARILQGVGGALLTPGSLAILQASFRLRDRAKAVGAWSGFGGIAGAMGPFLGGWLVDGPGWRWAFLLNVPLGALVLVCSRAIPETRDAHPGRIDVVGAVTAASALALGTWALTEAGPRGWTDPAVVFAGALALGAAGTFVWWILHTHAPLVPPALFRNRTFTVMNLATAVLYAAIGTSFFLVSYELQVAAGWSALAAGTALLPATVLMLVGSAPSGALAQRIGPRLQLTVGPLLAAAGLLLLTRIGPHTTWATDVLPGAFVFGLGLTTFVAPLTATVMASADPDHVSIASGVNNAIARSANLAAIAVIPVVSGLTAAAGAAEVTHSFRLSLLIAASVAAVASPLAFFGLQAHARAARSARATHCAVDGPPLQPDPARCPPVTRAA
jgi:MFS family permease